MELPEDYYTGVVSPHPVPVEYDADIGANMPRCNYCVRHYHPTKGESDIEGVCAECAVLYKLIENDLVEKKQEDLHVTSLPHIDDIVFPTIKDAEQFRKGCRGNIFGPFSITKEIKQKYGIIGK
jgi:hypothetical protein